MLALNVGIMTAGLGHNLSLSSSEISFGSCKELLSTCLRGAMGSVTCRREQRAQLSSGALLHSLVLRCASQRAVLKAEKVPQRGTFQERFLAVEVSIKTGDFECSSLLEIGAMVYRLL